MRFDNAVFETSFGVSKQLTVSDMPEIAFSGRSNVGKSSLLNKLMGRKALARVSATPGKTVTINFFKLDNCRLVDLPGYGYAKVSNSEKIRWAELMEGYFAQDRDLRLVVQLVDMRHKPSQQDYDMMDFMFQSGIPFAVAMTKSDKLNKGETAKMNELIRDELAKYGDIRVIAFSATNGEGTDELRKVIEEALEV